MFGGVKMIPEPDKLFVVYHQYFDGTGFWVYSVYASEEKAEKAAQSYNKDLKYPEYFVDDAAWFDLEL